MIMTDELQRPPGIPARWFQKSYRHHWPYIAQNGSVVGHAVRYDGSDGDKDVIPFFKQDGTRWQSGYAGGLRPLFGLEIVADTNSDATIYLAEGEKAAQAAQQLGLSSATSPAGSNAAHKADWEPLARFQSVVILPDNDDTGRKYAADVARILQNLPGERTIRVAALSGLPDKGDLVDWIQERVSDWDGYGPIPREPGDDLREELLAEIESVALVAPVACSPGEDPEIQPFPLVPESEKSEPYPVEALGPILGDAAKAIHEALRTPVALCGQAVLAAAAHAVQGLANVQMADGRSIPLSVFLLTIADTGERKTAVDAYALRPQRLYQRDLRSGYEALLEEYDIRSAVYEAARRDVLKKSGTTTQDKERALRELGQPPKKPSPPIVLTTDITIEGLQKHLERGHPSIAVCNDDAATQLSGYSFRAEAVAKTLADLSSFWNGQDISRLRSGDGHLFLRNYRVSMHLMMQPIIADVLLSSELAREQGFLGRCLISWPQSTRGTRTLSDTSLEDDLAYRRYTDTLLGILRIPLVMSDDGGNHLKQRPLPLSPDARELWRQYYDHVELQLVPGGDLDPIKGLASKAAEHAARLAAVITLIENPLAESVPGEIMANATTLMDYYLCECKRIFEIPAVDREVRDAELVRVWLVEKWAKKGNGYTIESRTLQQQVTPKRLRDSKAYLDRLMGILEDHQWVKRGSQDWKITTWDM